MALRLRRGTKAEILGIIPKKGEPLYATDTGELYVGDGVTYGGIRIAGDAAYQIDLNSEIHDRKAADSDIRLLLDSEKHDRLAVDSDLNAADEVLQSNIVAEAVTRANVDSDNLASALFAVASLDSALQKTKPNFYYNRVGNETPVSFTGIFGNNASWTDAIVVSRNTQTYSIYVNGQNVTKSGTVNDSVYSFTNAEDGILRYVHQTKDTDEYVTIGTWYGEFELLFNDWFDVYSIDYVGQTNEVLQKLVDDVHVFSTEVDSDVLEIKKLRVEADSDTLAIQALSTLATTQAAQIAYTLAALDSDGTNLQALRTELEAEIATTNAEVIALQNDHKADSDALIALDSRVTVTETDILVLKADCDSEYNARKEADSDLKILIDANTFLIAAETAERKERDSDLSNRISLIEDRKLDSDIKVNSIDFVDDGVSGVMSWNPDDRTVDLTISADVTLQVGQEIMVFARNNTGVNIANGQVVYISGAQGDTLEVSLASNVSELSSSRTFGMATEDISSGNSGFVTFVGKVRGINTSAWNEGDALWLGTNGNITTTKPVSPAHLVFIGWVARSHAHDGIVYVRTQNGYELEELHDVLITTPTEQQVVVYDSVNNLWVNDTWDFDAGEY